MRQEFDEKQSDRLRVFGKNFLPKYIRDNPSKLANYKMAANKLQYDIFYLTQWLEHTTNRAEFEKKVCNVLYLLNKK